MDEIRFIRGEDKHVKLLVHSVNDDPFVIRSAIWQLISAMRKDEEAAGECVIDGHCMDVKLNPQKSQDYILIITYEIADEVLKEKIKIKVE